MGLTILQSCAVLMLNIAIANKIAKYIYKKIDKIEID